MAKVWPNMMLVLPNVTMEPSNMRKKEKMRITDCDKSTVACNVGNAQCDNKIVKCEEKIQVPPNVRNVRPNVILKKVKESPNLIKELSYVILKPHIVRMELSNVRKKKVREPPNVKKNCYMLCWNCTM